jgi:2'-5' RNA ligase
MKFFVGIVPPANIYDTVVTIQNEFGDNRLEPHITIRPPETVTDESAWINAIEQVGNTFAPIPIHLPGTGSFGKRVLFIDVKSDSLAELHGSLCEAIKSFEQKDNRQQQSNSFHPHLTLGRSWCGFTPQDFAKMKILADAYLAKEPVTFVANFLRIYHKPTGKGRYATLKDVPLGSVFSKMKEGNNHTL